MSKTGIPTRPSNRDGFTLIEVLVALVILSTGLVLILEALGGALRALGDGRDALCATLFARDGLDRAQTDWRRSENLPERYSVEWVPFAPAVAWLGASSPSNDSRFEVVWLSSLSDAGDGGRPLALTNAWLHWKLTR